MQQAQERDAKKRVQLVLWTERPTSALVGAGSFWLRVDFKVKHPRLNGVSESFKMACMTAITHHMPKTYYRGGAQGFTKAPEVEWSE
jgi:hypothetical protein